MINPRRIPHKPVLNEVTSKAKPRAILELIIVCLWVRRQVIKLEARMVVKYPSETKRKKDPASAWLNPRSDSTAGIKGARTMRARKFTKKMAVSSSSGGNRSRNAFCN
jgi:hypothetical protein